MKFLVSSFSIAQPARNWELTWKRKFNLIFQTFGSISVIENYDPKIKEHNPYREYEYYSQWKDYDIALGFGVDFTNIPVIVLYLDRVNNLWSCDWEFLFPLDVLTSQ